MSNLFKWLVERLKERSSKQMLAMFLGALVLIGILPDGTDKAVVGLIETGQELYSEGRDSVVTTIDTGKELYTEGRDAVIRTIDTGKYFWAKVLAYLIAIGSFISGLFTKDAKGGVEYELREERIRARMLEGGMSPPTVDRILSL